MVNVTTVGHVHFSLYENGKNFPSEISVVDIRNPQRSLLFMMTKYHTFETPIDEAYNKMISMTNSRIPLKFNGKTSLEEAGTKIREFIQNGDVLAVKGALQHKFFRSTIGLSNKILNLEYDRPLLWSEIGICLDHLGPVHKIHHNANDDRCSRQLCNKLAQYIGTIQPEEFWDNDFYYP